MTRLHLLLSCLALVAACDKKDDAKAATAPAAAPADKPAAAAAAPAGTGLNDPGNDPKIVALAKPVLACKFEGTFFDDSCEAFKAWNAEKDLFADQKADATLVAFLEDSDIKVRDLGLRRLQYSHQRGACVDKALSARMVGVAEKAKGWPDYHAYTLGNLVGHIKMADGELVPRLKALVASKEVDLALRRPVIEGLLYSNDQSTEVWDLTAETLKSGEEPLRINALRALWTGATDKTHDARCALYKENLENPDDEIAGEAASYITRPQAGCKAELDLALASIEKRIKAKKVPNKDFVRTLAHYCEDNVGTPAQVKKATALAHQVADDKKEKARLRMAALEASLTCDPKGGKAYVGKFKKDADKEVSAAATELLTKK